jgi:hypothetical protein
LALLCAFVLKNKFHECNINIFINASLLLKSKFSFLHKWITCSINQTESTLESIEIAFEMYKKVTQWCSNARIEPEIRHSWIQICNDVNSFTQLKSSQQTVHRTPQAISIEGHISNLAKAQAQTKAQKRD